MQEIRTVLTETLFTSVCKLGYFTYGTGYTRTDVYFNKNDIKTLASGEILSKLENGIEFKFALQDIGIDLIKGIIQRSPLFADLYYEL
jgi:hypothetical protein